MAAYSTTTTQDTGHRAQDTGRRISLVDLAVTSLVREAPTRSSNVGSYKPIANTK